MTRLPRLGRLHAAAVAILVTSPALTPAFAQEPPPRPGAEAPAAVPASTEQGPASESQPPAPPPTEAPAPPAAPAAPYLVPFALRPAGPVTVIRLDTVAATYEDAMGNGGSSAVSFLTAAYKVTPSLSPLVRIGFAQNSPPMGASGMALTNAALGAIWGKALSPDLKLAVFAAATVPIGQGGGDTPDVKQAAAIGSGVLARSAMDNAMFAVDYLTVMPGLDLTWIKSGLTVQAEVTVLQLTRVKAKDVQPDSSRTNLTGGLFAGYTFIPQLGAGAELRYQRWLSTPVAVDKDGTKRETVSAAVGVRGTFKVGGGRVFRPALSFARGLDDPMAKAKYNVVQVDLILLM